MSLKTRALINVASSWGGLGVNIVVGFFVYPFILHHLGDDASGLWTLIYSLTGYYGILDFGIRSSLIRYVSKFRATGDKDELARLINTSLFTYTFVGLFLLILTTLGGFYVSRIFHIPASFLSDARILFLMVGYAMALDFPLGMSGGVLEGLQRFDLINWTNITSTTVSSVTTPPSRQGGSMVYDSTDGYVVLFGGKGTNGPLSDTWTFHLGAWSNISSTAGTAPPAPNVE